MASEVTKKKMGRPSTYSPDFCEKLIEHLQQGFSFEAFGAVCHASRDTLYEWVSKHKEFSDTKRLGESYSRYEWEKIGKLGMSGQVEGFNASVWIFNMKNRFGWVDKIDSKVESTGNVTINYSLVDSGS